MISHSHKCIFIHIAKCAGTSIESAFGVETNNHDASVNDFLFGWDKIRRIWLQHATPQQLIDFNLITREQWDSYYKFVIYRNSWSRAYSDYLWMMKTRNIKDSFFNFLNKTGAFKGTLTNAEVSHYAGDHLRSQRDYFFLDGKRIEYNREIDFDCLKEGISSVINDLSLPQSFFSYRLNESANKKQHYSYFYNRSKKKLVAEKYKDDIEFFSFVYTEKKNFLQQLISNIPSEKMYFKILNANKVFMNRLKQKKVL